MDHLQRSTDLTLELTQLRDELLAAHADTHGPNQRASIAKLYDAIRHTTNLARIHATLAVAQAVQDRSNFPGLAE